MVFSTEPDSMRTLLTIDSCTECKNLVPDLEACGWQIKSCDMADARLTDADVGLVRLRSGEPSYLDQLKRLIINSGIEWVAVVVPELLRKPKITDFIGEWFFDFHTLPFDRERVEVALGRAYGMARLRSITQHRDDPVDLDFLGSSRQASELRTLIAKLAPAESPVLIRGESGTGKELAARALHWQSRRKHGPFVAINCGAIPEHLMQSELFGHEKGAFTGAHQRKIGRIETADGGTLFLDEIGDLPLDLQANLLRFLQEMQVERVGGSKPISVDVRVIAATHVDLDTAIHTGRFREDLYYRLNVLEVETSPLRERSGDIAGLAHHFVNLYAAEVGRKPKRFSDKALQAMNQYLWPGNVRELTNRVRRGMVMAEGRQIEPQDLGFLSEPEPFVDLMPLREQVNLAEKTAVETAIATYPNSMKRVADALGVSRPTLYRLLHKHGLINDHSATHHLGSQ